MGEDLAVMDHLLFTVVSSDFRLTQSGANKGNIMGLTGTWPYLHKALGFGGAVLWQKQDRDPSSMGTGPVQHHHAERLI